MKTAPDPKDVQEFLFKQSNVTQVLEEFASVPVACNLLVADKKRGLLYIGRDNKIIVLKPGVDADPEWKLELELPVAVSKLTLSCDCSYLAVAQQNPSVLIYDAQALSKNSLQLLYEIRISSSGPDVFVNDLKWNPTISGMLCTIASDYTIGNFQIKEEKEKTIGLEALERLNGIDVLCAAWSPKGKQIVVGCKNGNLVQLKPDLKVARLISGPDPYIGEVITVLWISSYQFCAAYLDSEQHINVLIVDAPKGEATATFTCYEDITYPLSEGSMPRYYFDHVPEWGLIIAASSGSSEIAVLGSTDGGANWNQWQLVDSGRAQLPLIGTTESYPVGIAIDKSPTQKLQWGADSTLPQPVPILHILGTSGQLCSFHMVNLIPNCPAINVPPTELVKAPLIPRPSVAPPKPAVQSMSAMVTSTPRPKEPEHVPEQPKPVPMGNIFGENLKPTSLFQQPEPEKPKPPEPKPVITIEAANKVEVQPVKEVQPELVKADIKLTPPREEPPQEPAEQSPSIDDSICVRTYLEQQSMFEKELRSRLEVQTWECGTEEECKQLADRAAIIDQFLRDLRETTNSLSSDIAYLKALLLQSFAWLEEAKSKNAASNDITTRHCSDNSRMRVLQQLYYYTQTQLTQATKILDLQWSEHKDQEKSQMKIPSLEFVYQNLVLHNKIVAEEKNRIEQLKKRWKSLARTSNISGLNTSMSNLQIISPKTSASLRGNTSVIEARCKAIASKTLSFTQEKQVKLRQLLSESTPKTIKPVNPSPVQYRLEATLSSLASSGTGSPEVKSKVEQPVSKQAPVSKPPSEKVKQQSPLASLNNIVARIGSAESNSILPQNKPASKLPPVSTPFQSLQGAKFPQTEKKLTSPVPPRSVAQTNPPADVGISFGQMNSTTSLSKGFPKVDSIKFGAPLQKPQDSVAPKPVLKEAVPKPSKDLAVNNELPKVESKLFSTSSLKEVLPPDVSVIKVQGTVPGTSAPTMMTTPIAATPKPEPMTMFSFATPSAAPIVPKTAPQSTMLTTQPATHPTFSFAPKPATTVPSTLKLVPPPTQPQAQEVSQAPAGLPTGFPAPASTTSNSNNLNIGEIFCYKITTIMSGPGSIATTNAVSIGILNGASPNNTVTTTSSVVIEEIPSTDSMVPSLAGTTVQALPSSTATPVVPIFGGQSTTPIFGGAVSSAAATTIGTAVPAVAPPVAPAVAPAVAAAAPAVASAAPVATTTSPARPIQATTTTPPSTITFGVQLPTATTDIFKGFSSGTPATGTLSTTTASATTASPFYSSLAKPVFGEAAPATSTPSFTGEASTTSTTLSFGSFSITPTTTTAASIFGKTTVSPLATNSQFPTTPTVSSPSANAADPANVFRKPIISLPSMPFGSSSNAPVFGNAPANASGYSIFAGTAKTDSMFGTPTTKSSPGSIFGQNTAPMNTFGSSPQPAASIFENNAPKPDLVFGGAPSTGSPSFFGGAVAPASPPAAGTTAGSPSIFGGLSAGSPMGLGAAQTQQPAFGQTAFGGKPVFGSPPNIFGAAKPVFGAGFGTPAFGANAAPAFGSPPTLGGAPPPIDNNMDKVFGSTSGSSTFESLASQPGGLTFGNLAQKSPELEKPAFTGGSSFSSWR